MSFNIYVQLPLGLLFKNENKTDEMIDILTELHHNLLPVVQHENTITIPERCYFGGDQLTDERARNAVLVRSDGDDMHQQLRGCVCKILPLTESKYKHPMIFLPFISICKRTLKMYLDFLIFIFSPRFYGFQF